MQVRQVGKRKRKKEIIVSSFKATTTNKYRSTLTKLLPYLRTRFHFGSSCQKNLDRFSIYMCHLYAGAMLIFFVLFQFYRMSPKGQAYLRKKTVYEELFSFFLFSFCFCDVGLLTCYSILLKKK